MSTYFVAIVAYALSAGLTREEASKLASLLGDQDAALSIDEAWQQLQLATMTIRKERRT